MRFTLHHPDFLKGRWYSTAQVASFAPPAKNLLWAVFHSPILGVWPLLQGCSCPAHSFCGGNGAGNQFKKRIKTVRLRLQSSDIFATQQLQQAKSSVRIHSIRVGWLDCNCADNSGANMCKPNLPAFQYNSTQGAKVPTGLDSLSPFAPREVWGFSPQFSALRRLGTGATHMWWRKATTWRRGTPRIRAWSGWLPHSIVRPKGWQRGAGGCCRLRWECCCWCFWWRCVGRTQWNLWNLKLCLGPSTKTRMVLENP